MENSSQLFLIMSSGDFRYCVYRVCEPENNEDELGISELGEPLMKLHKRSCPEGMSFAAVGSRIFMIGGYFANRGDEPFRLSKETIIFDTLSSSYAPGPPLVSGKGQPFLFSVGSKIFALSRDIYVYDSGNLVLDPKPRFEVLNTDELERGWCALPVPRLYVTKQRNLYSVEACASNSHGIFMSVEDAGTYVFDLDKEVWNYVGCRKLPFTDQAVSMPLNLSFAPPSLCFAGSSKCDGFSAFHIRSQSEGDDDNDAFQVNEIEFDNSPLDLAPPLPPEIYFQWPLTVFDHVGRVYLVDSGVDNAHARDTHDGNRYVKVQVCDVILSGQQSSKSHGKKKKKVKRDLGAFMRKCTSSKHERKFGHEEGEVEDGKPFLRKCTKNNMEVGHNAKGKEVGVDGVTRNLDHGKSLKAGKNKMKREDRAKDETLEFKMNPIWRRSFFGGPMFEIWEHVYAVFAIEALRG